MVPLPIAARYVPRCLRVQQTEDRLRAGKSYTAGERQPFFSEIGRQLTPMAATSAFARIAKNAGKRARVCTARAIPRQCSRSRPGRREASFLTLIGGRSPNYHMPSKCTDGRHSNSTNVRRQSLAIDLITPATVRTLQNLDACTLSECAAFAIEDDCPDVQTTTASPVLQEDTEYRIIPAVEIV